MMMDTTWTTIVLVLSLVATVDGSLSSSVHPSSRLAFQIHQNLTTSFILPSRRLHRCSSFPRLHESNLASAASAEGSSATPTNAAEAEEIHPAVTGWPEKYQGSALAMGGNGSIGGPRILHNDFVVIRASPMALQDLDVANWPIWTTQDKPKWAVGNQNTDKVMPYGELSYVLSGKLEIIPARTGQPVIVEPGNFVTFPQGFQACWKVLEELTWHYYLY